MTVIDIIECPICGDEIKVTCRHDGRKCQYCGLPFHDEAARREHEERCKYS